MKDMLLTLLRIFLSLPLAILLIVVYSILMLGWGLKIADKFLVSWNAFVNDNDVEWEKKDD